MEKEHFAVGLMSGTSVDGIDTGIFSILLRDDRVEKVEIREARTYPFPAEIRKEILELCSGTAAGALARLTLLNMRLGDIYAACVNRLLEETGFPRNRIEVIGSHGQTIWHAGSPEPCCGRPAAGTLQIGEASVIAQRTGIPVVSDFRPADMAAGGGGAPLVPLLDLILAEGFEGPAAFQNIGGIGNVGYVRNGRMTAFDTGPGNMIIDRLTELHTEGKQHYDRDGLIGRSGRLRTELLDLWMNHPYLGEKPPKTAGREQFGEQFFRDFPVPDGIPGEDLIRTAAVYTGKSIARSYRQWLPEGPATVIVTGGGAHNPLIMETLKADLPSACVLTGDQAGISTDYKEAAAFALLALNYLQDRPGNVPDATGAERGVICGKLSKPLPEGGLPV